MRAKYLDELDETLATVPGCSSPPSSTSSAVESSASLPHPGHVWEQEEDGCWVQRRMEHWQVEDGGQEEDGTRDSREERGREED